MSAPETVKDPYEAEFRLTMEGFGEGLGENPRGVVGLPGTKAHDALTYLLKLACQAQNARNIELARWAFQSLPREWLMPHLELLAAAVLNLDDEWEYRRLLELCAPLDRTFARRWAQRALTNRNAEIKEAGEDFLLKLAEES